MAEQLLQIGDRIKLSGGYEQHPSWLDLGSTHRLGTVVDFLPKGGKWTCAVVELDRSIRGAISGKYLVLHHRHGGPEWEATGVVHLELCDFRPRHDNWPEERKGTVIECAADYERIL